MIIILYLMYIESAHENQYINFLHIIQQIFLILILNKVNITFFSFSPPPPNKNPSLLVMYVVYSNTHSHVSFLRKHFSRGWNIWFPLWSLSCLNLKQLGLVLHQNAWLIKVSCYSAVDWEFVTIGDEHFLIVSNAQNRALEGDHLTSIYKWRGVEKFVRVHQMDVLPNTDWEVFTDKRDVYFVYSNAKGKTSQVLKAVFTPSWP